MVRLLRMCSAVHGQMPPVSGLFASQDTRERLSPAGFSGHPQVRWRTAEVVGGEQRLPGALSRRDGERIAAALAALPGRLCADLLQRFAFRAEAVLGTAVVALIDHGSEVSAASRPASTGGPAPPVAALREFGAGGAPGVHLVTVAGTTWTLVRVPRGGGAYPLLLGLQGDWGRSNDLLQRLAEGVLPRSRRQDLGVVAHRLACVLGRVSGVAAVADTFLRHVVRVVPTRLAAIAVPSHSDHLVIAATYGYPLDLVKDIRIHAGAGVIGTVFQQRRALCVTDIASVPRAVPRRRYRTNSFIALPLTAGADVLGVVCLTDRSDDAPFTRGDLSKLRAVAAPASLALARERQRDEASRLAHAAMIDPLSGLFNRRYLQERLSAEMQRGHRQQSAVSLLLIDIDNFKQINDSFGHSAGDAVIAQISKAIHRAVRSFDTCSRFGGEEFAVLMPGTTREGALGIADRIRRHIEADLTIGRSFRGRKVTVSIGVATAPRGGVARDLVDAADCALYAAKRAGKNQVAG